MIDRIRADEALQVLVFVCVPLLLLLAAAITMLVRGSRTIATFLTFTVTISKVAHEEAYVIFRDNNRQTEFPAEIGRPRRFFLPRISVRVPREMPDEEVRQIVPNLALGLAKLHYEYLIYRKGQPKTIPAEERETAVAQLRQMGFEVESSGQAQIQRALAHDWQRSSGKKTVAMISQVQSLLQKARGVRESIEVLARSESTRWKLPLP